MNGREAFFSLMAIKMMKLSHKYQRKLEDLHSIFYMVSCDWQILESILEAQLNEALPGGQQASDQLQRL